MASAKPFGAVECLIAVRYLGARKGRGAISLIAGFSLTGIAIGVATLMVVLAVMDGFRHELLGRILGFNGHLALLPVEQTWAADEGLLRRLRAVPGTREVIPVLEGQALLTSAAGGASGVLLRGIEPAMLSAHPALAPSLRVGRFEALTKGDAIALGSALSRQLEVGVGDQVTLISPEGRTTVFGTVPWLKTFVVAAIFEVGVHDYDSGVVFVSLETAQQFLRRPGLVNRVEVHLLSPERLSHARQIIDRMIEGSNLVLFDWQEASSGFFHIVRVQRNVMVIILALIIVVAAFNLVSSLILLVKDKVRDIAILRSMGAKAATVMRIFLVCGAVIGTVGVACGIGLGLLLCNNLESLRQALMQLTGVIIFDPEVYSLTRLPTVIDPVAIAHIALFAIILSLLATLYPAWRAAWLDPVEALRNE